MQGTRLWEQAFGVPPADGESHARPEVRKYILQQVNYAQKMKLYVRVTDQAESQVFKVASIGPMVSFSRPDELLDQQSNLHVMYQCGARLYNYSVTTPEGNLVLRQSYDVTATRPHMKIDEHGKINVVDGLRRIAADDIPSPADPSNPHETLATKP